MSIRQSLRGIAPLRIWVVRACEGRSDKLRSRAKEERSDYTSVAAAKTPLWLSHARVPLLLPLTPASFVAVAFSSQTLLVLVLLIISLLVWMVIKEDRAIGEERRAEKTRSLLLQLLTLPPPLSLVAASLTNTLDTVNSDAASPSWKKSPKTIILFVCFGAVTSGVNGFFMWRLAALKQLQAKEAAAAAEALLARAPSTFLERRFPILNAILPGDPHEMILYILNFLMILQSVKVWQNWRHSPVAGAIRKWQSTRLNKMLRNRELRRIQRRAARELAKTQVAPAAASTAAAAFALVTRGGAAAARRGAMIRGKLLFGSIKRIISSAITSVLLVIASIFGTQS